MKKGVTVNCLSAYPLKACRIIRMSQEAVMDSSKKPQC